MDGIERTAFFDANGNSRTNPFKVGNIKRERVNPFGKAQPLDIDVLKLLFTHLEKHKYTILGSRNYALMLAYFLTACRNHEILHIKWGDIRVSNADPNSFIFEWHGKGNKSQSTPLPNKVYDAIVDHLKLSQRWPLQPDDYIWLPIVTHGSRNLASFGKPPAAKHISGRNAIRILHTALRLAGVPDPEKYRVHDLRHTFAIMFERDVETLRKIMHHSSVAATGQYMRALKDPLDNYSNTIWNKLDKK